MVMCSKEDLKLIEPQSKTLEEMRKRIRGELDDEYQTFDETYLCYRFLKARNWDIDRAENMLRKCLQWRKRNNFMNDYKPTEFLKKYFANFHIGYDKEGCPVFYAPTGKYDVNGIHMAARYSDIESTLYQILAQQEKYLEEESKKVNRPLTGFVIIFDADGLTLSNAINKFGLEIFIRLSKMQQDMFPERLKALFFINVNSYFKIPFNIVKTFLSFRTLPKIYVYGTDDWQEELLRMVDVDQLPVFLGGTKTDPCGDPLCSTFINQGGVVDEIYYIHKSVSTLANTPGVEKILIPRASSVRIPVGIQDSGSVIEWHFETKSGDIGFGLLFKFEGGLKEVVSVQRLNTKDFSESSMYRCEEIGEYFMLFDNSYSWFQSKEVFYQIKILRPDELEERICG